MRSTFYTFALSLILAAPSFSLAGSNDSERRVAGYERMGTLAVVEFENSPILFKSAKVQLYAVIEMMSPNAKESAEIGLTQTGKMVPFLRDFSLSDAANPNVGGGAFTMKDIKKIALIQPDREPRRFMEVTLGKKTYYIGIEDRMFAQNGSWGMAYSAIGEMNIRYVTPMNYLAKSRPSNNRDARMGISVVTGEVESRKFTYDHKDIF